MAVALVLFSLPLHGQTLVSIQVAQVLDVNVPTTLVVGDDRQFTAVGTYSDNSTQYLTQQVTWTSENTGIATVSTNMGLVLATGPGTVNIDATLDGIQGSSSLTVIADTLTGVVLTPAAPALQTGASQQFYATATLGANVINDVTSLSNWSTTNKAVATVSSTGMVTAVGPGTATIGAAYSTRKGTVVVTVTSTPPPNLGQWSQPQNLGMLAIHGAVLHTGKLLLWGYPVGRNGGPSPARLYDPIANTLTDVTLPFPVDIFCSAESFLYDGRVMVSGGLDDFHYPADSGIWNTTFFDPSTNAWSAGPLMNLSRWYPTSIPMPDGTVLVASGTDNNGTQIQVAMESYSVPNNTWTLLPTSANMPTPNDDYPLFNILPSGNVFWAAPRLSQLGSNMYNPGTQTWSFVGNLNFGPREHAADIMLPKSQKVMIVGGSSTKAGGPTATTEIIDFSQPSPAWVYGPSLNIARYNDNLIYLADGTILAVGGDQASDYTNPIYQPELFDPVAGTWSLMAPQSGSRGYHSTSFLLPDGRVLSAGSDSGIALENTYEIYSPPYLSNGPRPTITFSPVSVRYGQIFNITTPNAASIRRVALIRPGATTHANQMDDKYYVDLSFSASASRTGAGQITAIAPGSPNFAVPGYYMLVIVNSNGVPSVMPFIQLKTASEK
ncbi:MAG TPA: galactose oxidase-like domain-containing protein [Terriglobales bacterium]|nr:galactose oxidase-like domain-containing protein [Terriglobales bacterium]